MRKPAAPLPAATEPGGKPESPAALRVYQLRICLRKISPIIWRRLLVRGDSSIADLHYTLQIAVGWTDSHLHRFRIHGKDYGVAHMGGISFDDDPRQVCLADFGFRLRERFLYEYDFYDLWQHDIRVEQILGLDAKRSYPVCIAGRRAAPPEDCGGPRAFFQGKREVPGEIHRSLLEMAEEIESGDLDLDGVRDRMASLESLRLWLSLEQFDRRGVNQRLRDYAKGERQWLFAQPVG
jgi:hypothetical protein